MKTSFVIALVFIGAAVAARPPEEEQHKSRVVKDEDLSKQEHFHDSDHNPEYDHEAFVGEDEARKYEELTPDQSKERLGHLVDKIDKNSDGFVTEKELEDWIKYTQNKYIYDDVERQLKTTDMNDDKMVSWEEYKNATYGFGAEQDDFTYKDMLGRDERRFKKADKSGNGRLSKEEFVAFLHPENDPDMKDIIVDETLEDIDKDKDGALSMDEYIGDMWPEDERKANPNNPPDWVVKEREQFSEFRDKNKDGKMDRDEVRDWILPADYDHVSAEAKHLIQEADENKDGILSKTEIVEKYDLFVGSQATDFGDALQRNHDEF